MRLAADEQAMLDGARDEAVRDAFAHRVRHGS